MIDVVIVSYNSRDRLRACVESLVGQEGVDVVVVDNDSPDRSLEAVADLPVRAIQLDANRGFAHGCNVGWRAGESPFVLFLNPDATIPAESLRRLASVLAQNERVGVVGPKILESDGVLDFSQRRFPRLRSTYAHALFLNQVWPRAPWASELVQDERAYDEPAFPDWISGACLLTRRALLEQLDGWDERFFLYSEDKDLCRRIRDAGYEVQFEPSAVAVHEGGASGPREALFPILATSRIRYAAKHEPRPLAWLERLGIALTALTHALVTRGGRRTRAGHAAALRAATRRTGA